MFFNTFSFDLKGYSETLSCNGTALWKSKYTLSNKIPWVLQVFPDFPEVFGSSLRFPGFQNFPGMSEPQVINE